MTTKENLKNFEGLLSLEQPLIKVPLEQFKRAIRNSQKYLEREMTFLNTQVNSPQNPVSHSNIDLLVNRLNNLKRKLEETKGEETLFANRTKTRLLHLNELNPIQSIDSEDFERFSKKRMDRLIIDYMLRKGYIETALCTAKESQIEDLVDIELFVQSRKVEESLANHSCGDCLQWCSDNKSNLKKMKSTLEFNLRVQEFVELVRQRKITDAIVYAKKFLSPFNDIYLKEIQQVTALLAFSPSTTCQVYKNFFEESKWENLINQFRMNNFVLSNLTTEPMFNITLQAGLSALKTVNCSENQLNKNLNCPVCDETSFGLLSSKLPMAHHVNSCIVCRISGEIINENNPPLVLPNGFVYSKKALMAMADQNDGNVRCPRSGSIFHITQVRKAFIL